MGQAADEGKLLLNSAFPPRWVRWRLTLTCPPPSLLFLSLSLPSPLSLQLWAINPLLFMKIYNIAIQVYDAARVPIGRSLSRGGGGMNMNFFFRPVFFIFNFQLRDRGAFHLTVSDFHGNLFTVDLRHFTISHICFWGFF